MNTPLSYYGKEFTTHICDDKYRMIRIEYSVKRGEEEVGIPDSFTIKQIYLETEDNCWRRVTKLVKNRKELVEAVENNHRWQ